MDVVCYSNTGKQTFCVSTISYKQEYTSSNRNTTINYFVAVPAVDLFRAGQKLLFVYNSDVDNIVRSDKQIAKCIIVFFFHISEI